MNKPSSTQTSTLPALLGLGLLAACRLAEPEAIPVPAPDQAAPIEAAAEVEAPDSVFAYLLQRYDGDGDGQISSAEYTRHDGQLARWDKDGDGCVTESDLASEELRVVAQIKVMQRMDVLGRYFQTEENALEVLTIDELANAFSAYQQPGLLDEELTRSEFDAASGERAVEMPGDGSMMMQSYVGEDAGWERLVRYCDTDGSQTLSMEELTLIFDEQEVYELRFDQVRFDDGAAGARFEERAYRAGLVVGSPMPDVTLTTLNGDPPLELASLAGKKPVALIFGSYT